MSQSGALRAVVGDVEAIEYERRRVLAAVEALDIDAAPSRARHVLVRIRLALEALQPTKERP